MYNSNPKRWRRVFCRIPRAVSVINNSTNQDTDINNANNNNNDNSNNNNNNNNNVI